MIELIQGTPPDRWLPVLETSDSTVIDEDIQTISCDTRDFHFTWRTETDDAAIELRNNPDKQNCLIKDSEIFPWLSQLCNKTGGKMKWRHLNAKVPNCTSWSLKYIVFVRDLDETDSFIVCNRHMVPVHYKEILDNIYDPFSNI